MKFPTLWKGFSTQKVKNPFQRVENLFGCRFGDFELIPTQEVVSSQMLCQQSTPPPPRFALLLLRHRCLFCNVTAAPLSVANQPRCPPQRPPPSGLLVLGPSMPQTTANANADVAATDHLPPHLQWQILTPPLSFHSSSSSLCRVECLRGRQSIQAIGATHILNCLSRVYWEDHWEGGEGGTTMGKDGNDGMALLWPRRRSRNTIACCRSTTWRTAQASQGFWQRCVGSMTPTPL